MAMNGRETWRRDVAILLIGLAFGSLATSWWKLSEVNASLAVIETKIELLSTMFKDKVDDLSKRLNEHVGDPAVHAGLANKR